MRYIFDVETDGFLESYITIHCMVLLDIDTQEVHRFGPFEIAEGVRRLQAAELIVGHNIIKFDLPVIRKLYPGFVSPEGFRGVIRDTLVMSRLIYANLKDRDFAFRHKRPDFPTKMIGKHALEAWGHRLDTHKDRFAGPWEQ
jgi:DNA polymerase-1